MENELSHTYLVEMATADVAKRLKIYQSLVEAYADYGDLKMRTPFIGMSATPRDYLDHAKRAFDLSQAALLYIARRAPSPSPSAAVSEEQVEAVLNHYHLSMPDGWAYGSWANYRKSWPSDARKYEDRMRAALLASGLGDGAGWVSAGTIYTLMGSYDYEGCTVLASYASKAGAEAELAKRNAYKASEPRQSDYVNEDGTRDADAWWAASEKWREGLEGASNYDSYYLVEKELLP